MDNPFEILNARLSNIESLLLDIKHPKQSPEPDPYGDFKWLSAICHSVPDSTLRIKSASSEIPGVVKFGKRVLYEKAVVLEWLRSQTRTRTDTDKAEQVAETQITQQLIKKKGIK